MSVSVAMPQLGESVTEGTVTRWLKKEGEHVTADEPLLEVSTDKVDTEIPSPASGILRGIAVDEDETVAVGAQLAVIEDRGRRRGARRGGAAPRRPSRAQPAAGGAPAPRPPQRRRRRPRPPPPAPAAAPARAAGAVRAAGARARRRRPAPAWSRLAAPGPGRRRPVARRPSPAAPPACARRACRSPRRAPAPAAQRRRPRSRPPRQPSSEPRPTPTPSPPRCRPATRRTSPRWSASSPPSTAVPLEAIAGTGVGGRIRKQDVLEAARAQRAAEAAAAAAAAAAAPTAAAAARAGGARRRARRPPAAAPPGPARRSSPSALRGTTQRMSRPRQVIAKRMVESLQTSAQLTTVVEADVTNIARLRDRAKAEFEAREGVKLTFLPFFAQATVEALKVHPSSTRSSTARRRRSPTTPPSTSASRWTPSAA